MSDRIDYAVQVEQLSRHFGSFKAVDRISLSVRTGEIFGFLGANGAGKTTAIRMLTGLLQPSEGSGTVAGYDILTQPEEIKKSIGYMSQKFSLYRDLTGRENLSFYAAAYNLNRNTTRRRIAELTDRLGLGEFIDRLTADIPVGWRQRLGLSAALLHEPRILFLDEPTGGVDPAFRREFWSVLYDLADDNVTLFVTTHYMDEAEFCQRISVMHAGHIVELGSPRDLISKYQQPNLEETFIHLIRNQDKRRS
jgi:ABC-2 type transport system ATP-binding protein